MKLLALLVLVAAVALPADNFLAVEEQKAGWVLLFDGRTMRGWRDPATENPPGDSWEIEDGCIKTRMKPRISEDLVSAASYGDFELTFDWRMSPGGNSGVKYRIQRMVFVDNTKAPRGRFEAVISGELMKPLSDRARLDSAATAQEYAIGFEMQLLDDDRHPDAKNGPKYRTGALYSMIAPTTAAAKTPGEWNSGRIVAKGDHIEHWINGVRVLSGSLSDEGVREGAGKRWGQYPEVLRMFTEPKPSGPISLQHHGDAVWFRNIKIRGQ
jgi:hypothetical protein